MIARAPLGWRDQPSPEPEPEPYRTRHGSVQPGCPTVARVTMDGQVDLAVHMPPVVYRRPNRR